MAYINPAELLAQHFQPKSNVALNVLPQFLAQKRHRDMMVQNAAQEEARLPLLQAQTSNAQMENEKIKFALDAFKQLNMGTGADLGNGVPVNELTRMAAHSVFGAPPGKKQGKIYDPKTNMYKEGEIGIDTPLAPGPGQQQKQEVNKTQIIDGQLVTILPDGTAKAVPIPGFVSKPKEDKVPAPTFAQRAEAITKINDLLFAYTHDKDRNEILPNPSDIEVLKKYAENWGFTLKEVEPGKAATNPWMPFGIGNTPAVSPKYAIIDKTQNQGSLNVPPDSGGVDGQINRLTSQSTTPPPVSQQQITLSPDIKTTGQALLYLMNTYNLTEDQAIQWIQQNAN